MLITYCSRAGGLADGTIAGSVLKLNHAVRNLLDYTDLPVWEAVNAASLNPARRIGVDNCKGSLETGKDADIAIVNENFDVLRTIVGGRSVYTA